MLRRQLTLGKWVIIAVGIWTMWGITSRAEERGLTFNKPYLNDKDTVLLLHFDEGTGPAVKDSSDNGNDGRLDAGDGSGDSNPAWTDTDEAKFGKALSFDGKDDFVVVPNRSSLNLGTNDFTIECWVQILSHPGNSAMLVLKGQGGYYDYRLYIRQDRHIIGEILGENSATWLEFVSERTAPLEKWFHLALVMDRKNAEVSGIYINGIRVRQAMVFSGWKKFSDQTNIDLSNDSNLYLGITPWARMYANVIMDELRISKVARFQPAVTAVSTPGEKEKTEGFYFNQGFEEAEGDRPALWDCVEQEGAKIALDNKEFKSGKNSVRLEDTEAKGKGYLLLQSPAIPVKPGKKYQFSCWVYSKGLHPELYTEGGGGRGVASIFKIPVFWEGPGGPWYDGWMFQKDFSGWTKIDKKTFDIYNKQVASITAPEGAKEVRIRLELINQIEANKVKVWIDDVEFKEVEE